MEATIEVTGLRTRFGPTTALDGMTFTLDAAALQPSRTGRNHLLWLGYSQGFSGRRVDEVLRLTGLESAARGRAGGYSLGRWLPGTGRCWCPAT